MEKISVILPVYNSQKTILETLNSVLYQTYDNIELIIINDGSTDDTENICNKLRNRKIKYIKTENRGVSNARNIGLEYATGDYIMFIDSDDKYKNNMIEKMIMNINDTDIVCCNYQVINNKGVHDRQKLTTQKFSQKDKMYLIIEYLRENQVFNMVWNKIYKAKIIKENNIKFDINIKMGEDYRFNIDYWNYIENVKIISDKLYQYNCISNGLSKLYDKNEFDRRISNLNYHRKYYEKNKFPLDYINKRYIISAYGGIENLFHNKEKMKFKSKIQEVKRISNNEQVIKSIKAKQDSSIFIKIYAIILQTKNSTLIIFVTYLISALKKLSNKL